MDRRKTELNVQPTKISGRLHFMCLQMPIMPKWQATEISLLPFRVSYVIYNYLKVGKSLIFTINKNDINYGATFENGVAHYLTARGISLQR